MRIATIAYKLHYIPFRVTNKIVEQVSVLRSELLQVGIQFNCSDY